MEALIERVTTAIASRGYECRELVHIGGYLGRSFVFSAGNFVVKCFVHKADSKFDRECRAYAFLATSALPVPKLVASGKLDTGTPWILTTKLPGQVGAETLQGLPPQARIDLHRELGTLLAKLHLLEVDERLTGMPLAAAGPDYRQSMEARLQRYIAESKASDDRQRSRALVQSWAEASLRYLPANLCAVHGDFSWRNVMLLESDHRWHVSGLIDFEHSEYGDPAADFSKMLLASDDWHGREFNSFLDAYARLRPLPAREQVLLHLSAFALDATSWAFEKDRPYYEFLLDIVDRMDANPAVFPARFPATA